MKLLDKSIFPNVVKMLQIAATIPSSNATCERLFSALKRIKTYLRSSMKDNQLSLLAIISIELQLSTNINYNHVANVFAEKSRRIDLVL